MMVLLVSSVLPSPIIDPHDLIEAAARFGSHGYDSGYGYGHHGHREYGHGGKNLILHAHLLTR